jgi:hypothetical protein
VPAVTSPTSDPLSRALTREQAIFVTALRDACNEVRKVVFIDRELFETASRAFAHSARSQALPPEKMLVQLKDCLIDFRLGSESIRAYHNRTSDAVRWAIDEYYRDPGGT